MRAILLILLSFSLLAADAPEDAPRAKPDDVASLDSIVKALYDVISGPAGQKRDWARMKSLFLPQGRLIALRTTPEKTQARVMSLDEYIANATKAFESQGFYEGEISRKEEEFGGIAHVFSTYESRHNLLEKAFARGINSIQLMKDKERWWIVDVFWDAERPDQPIPAKYLPPGKTLASNLARP